MISSDVAGIWDTNFGRLELWAQRKQVTGAYGSDGGRLEGSISGNKVRGNWRQRAVSGYGDTWGTFTLEFDSDGESFAGKWSYGDDWAPDGGTWSGRRWWEPQAGENE